MVSTEFPLSKIKYYNELLNTTKNEGFRISKEAQVVLVGCGREFLKCITERLENNKSKLKTIKKEEVEDVFKSEERFDFLGTLYEDK